MLLNAAMYVSAVAATAPRAQFYLCVYVYAFKIIFFSFIWCLKLHGTYNVQVPAIWARFEQNKLRAECCMAYWLFTEISIALPLMR